MPIECPDCGKRFYAPQAHRRKRSTDPSALVALPPLDEGDDWLTTEQVAAKLGIKPASLPSMVFQGRFPKADCKWRGRNYWKLSTLEYPQAEMMPPEGWPEIEPSDLPPRGGKGQFIKIEKVEINFHP
ncbi:hypothetical protein ACLQ2R_05280 [Streptosporangium sp. DT93]|uniref:hypothetical protein n=1 Tax=Streptosporangium sp. DT93 TaxID=3393428 RepID=UPI003CEC373C